MSDSKKALEEALALEQEAAIQLQKQQEELAAIQRKNAEGLSHVSPENSELTSDEGAVFEGNKTTEELVGSDNKGEPIIQITKEGVLSPPEQEKSNENTLDQDSISGNTNTSVAPQPQKSKVDILGFPDPILKKLGIDAKPKGVAPTQQEQNMLSTLLEKAPKTGFTPKLLHNVQDSLDKLNDLSEKNHLSEEQQKDLTEFLKIEPKNPSPEFSPKEQEKFDAWCEDNNISNDLKNELEDILIVQPQQPKPLPENKNDSTSKPLPPKPDLNSEEQEKLDSVKDKVGPKFKDEKNFDNIATRFLTRSPAQLVAMKAILDNINELLNRNDEVDKGLEVQYQELEKIMYGTDTPIESQQVGATDNAMELLERLCATDGFISLAEKNEMHQQMAENKADNKKEAVLDAAVDAALDSIEEQQANNNRPSMKM